MGRFSCKRFAKFCIKEILETTRGSSGRRTRAPSIPVHICHPLIQTTGNGVIVLIKNTGPLLFGIDVKTLFLRLKKLANSMT